MQERKTFRPLASSAARAFLALVLALFQQTQNLAERFVPGSNEKVLRIRDYYQTQWKKADEASSEIVARIQAKASTFKEGLTVEKVKLCKKINSVRDNLSKIRQVPFLSAQSLAIILDMAPFVGSKISREAILNIAREAAINVGLARSLGQQLYLSGCERSRTVCLQLTEYGSQVQLKIKGLKDLSKEQVIEAVALARSKINTTLVVSKERVSKIIFDREQLQNCRVQLERVVRALVGRVREVQVRTLARQQSVRLWEWAAAQYKERRQRQIKNM